MIDHRTYRARTKPTTQATTQAKTLRNNLSPPETLLWSALRNNQINSLAFRSQHPIGPYIADFYCRDARLVIEVDGNTHQGQQLKHDDTRDQWMQSCGIHVMRFKARDVFADLNAVVNTITRIATMRADEIKSYRPD